MNGIRIGRINKKVERLLQVDFGADVFLYVDNDRLNSLAKARPDSYLADLEKLTEITAKPDYVVYEKNNVTFIREYLIDASFHKVMAAFAHRKRWELTLFSGLGKEGWRILRSSEKIIKVD